MVKRSLVLILVTTVPRYLVILSLVPTLYTRNGAEVEVRQHWFHSFECPWSAIGMILNINGDLEPKGVMNMRVR
jgi:hypothetical protein